VPEHDLEAADMDRLQDVGGEVWRNLCRYQFPQRLEQYANVEILSACMDYVTGESRWPTPEEIATFTGIGMDHVMEVEYRLGGTYEFALRAGFTDGPD
jgi:hypothetical protein